ncbi:MAG: hypothetical protein JWO36_369 [Myxococcales bacterium]|nr:hypothetical protein [Myxococcales bacterium]
MIRIACLVALVACGAKPKPLPSAPPVSSRVPSAHEAILSLLPDGVQIVVEIDLVRLRKNGVVGEVVTKALAQLGADARLPGLPVAVQGSPLAQSDAIVLAAYGVGTPQAATITLLETKSEVTGGTRLSPELVALGPDEWIGQLQARAAIAAEHPFAASAEFLRLRDHAMPAGATGAVLRITARLPFDARIALARQTGLETAPAQLSLWADVADDLAIVIDADSADPGDRKSKEAARRLAAVVHAALALAANEPTIREIGVGTSLVDARLVAQGGWIRAIIAIGPRHLARAIERARAMLGAS